MKTFALVFASILSLPALAESSPAWDSVLVMRMAQQPETAVICGDGSYVIGGTKVSAKHLMYYLKSAAIDCKSTGPRGEACKFPVEILEPSADNQNNYNSYIVEFSVSRGPSGAGPFVALDNVKCTKTN